MNIGIDIDGTLTKYPKFFADLGHMFRDNMHKVYIITGLGHNSAVEKLKKIVDEQGDGFYDALIDTSMYNDFEKSLIGRIAHNEIIVGHFKQRMCRELGVDVMFDDQADLHRYCGDVPIFTVK